MKQPAVRQINAHLASMTTYAYVDRTDGAYFRITRARTRQGVKEGRVLNGVHAEPLGDWEPIPADAKVHLTNF